MKKFKFKINDNQYDVSVKEIDQNIAEVEVNGKSYTVEIERQEKSYVSTVNKKPAGKVEPISTPIKNVTASAIKAQLPGSIMKVLIVSGQTVKRGDLLLTMESMKMENNILAENDGIIKTVYVKSGDTVMQDDILIDFTGSESSVVSSEPSFKEASASLDVHVSTPNFIPGTTATKVKSPLPGNIIKIDVTIGQAVKRGDQLLTLESMKMENSITAEKNGTVKSILVKQGDAVMQDDVLFEIE